MPAISTSSGGRSDLVTILWHDGLGMSLYAKRLGRDKFIWPFGVGRRRIDLSGADGLCWKGLTGGLHNRAGDREARVEHKIQQIVHSWRSPNVSNLLFTVSHGC